MILAANLLMVLLVELIRLSHAKCPSAELIDPCYCDNNNIYCGGTQSFNFKRVFDRVSKSFDSASDKNFDLFYMNNTAITEFENDMFVDLTFKNIHIKNATNLRRIYAHAFTGNILNTLEVFQQEGSSLLGDEDQYVSELFDALSSLLSVRMIRMERTKLKAIPANAFHVLNGAQNQLTHIELNRGSVTSVGDRAFYVLKNLQNIYLEDQQLSQIQLHAFDFQSASNKTLSIHLTGNDIESTGIAVNAFTDAKRPLHIYLNNNPITHLVPDVFRPILRADNSSVIDIAGIPLKCNCDTAWLVRDKTMYSNRILNGQCKGSPNDTIPLWNLKLSDFFDCPDSLLFKI